MKRMVIVILLIISFLLVNTNISFVLAANSFILGDVNNNGKIDTLDFIAVRKHILGTTKLSDEEIKRADTDSDGKVTSLDYIKIRQAIINNTSIVSTAPIKVTSVKLNKTSISLEVKNTSKLIATVSPNDATDKSVTWASSNEKIAKVDKNGKITAIGRGVVTITVTTTDGNKTAKCDVKVLEPVDLALLWGQSNMVGRGGKTSELKLQVDKEALLKAGIDKDIVENTKSYGRVELSMKKDMAFEYKAGSNKLVDIVDSCKKNPQRFGETLYYNNGKLTSNDPNDGSVNLQYSTAINMIPYFAKEYTEKTNHKIVFVHAAHGGYYIQQFKPDHNNNMYKAMVTKYKMAVNYLEKNYYIIKNKFYVVYQGESDCTSLDNRADNYKEIYQEVHTSLIKDLQLSFGAMVHMGKSTISCDSPSLKKVRDAQSSLAKKYNNLIIGTDIPNYQHCVVKSTAIFGGEGNEIHLNGAGLSQVGRDIAKNIVKSGKINN